MTAAKARTTATLPALFVLAATSALTGGGSELDPVSVQRELEAAAKAVRRIISARGLIEGDTDLVIEAATATDRDLAENIHVRDARRHLNIPKEEAQWFQEALSSAYLDGVRSGLHHGLVAGYLIGQLLPGGAR